MGGAVKVIRPTDLRNRVGLYMMEERGIKMGRNVDPGDVQDMIVEFTQRELLRASDPQKGQGWATPESLYRIAMKLMIGRGTNTPWPDVADFEIEAWLTAARERLSAPPSVPAGPQEEKK